MRKDHGRKVWSFLIVFLKLDNGTTERYIVALGQSVIRADLLFACSPLLALEATLVKVPVYVDVHPLIIGSTAILPILNLGPREGAVTRAETWRDVSAATEQQSVHSRPCPHR